MTYQEAKDFLFQQLPMFERNGAADYKPGLSTISRLAEWLDKPHCRFRSIHVAGTNGKGSVSHSLAAILQQMGFRVGLFTSPHLVDFRERIRVNGQPVDENYVADFVERYRQSSLGRNPDFNPTFFELTTALAFNYFAESKVQWAVIETGLGGRLDSTNIIVPQLSVITNISLDHTSLLGHTLAEIASEKAGIIKPGVPVVIGEAEDETRPVFEQAARAVGAPIVFAEEMDTTAGIYESELQGAFQLRNTNTVACAMHVLFDCFVRQGLKHVCELTGLHGRWETLRQRPLVICDTGHNPGAWQYLGPQVAAVQCRQRRVVFGMVADKDVENVVGRLPKDAIYYLTQPSSHRAKPVQELRELAIAKGLTCPHIYNNVCDAYQAALGDSAPDDFIFVGGSSYLVGDLLASCQVNGTTGSVR